MGSDQPAVQHGPSCTQESPSHQKRPPHRSIPVIAAIAIAVFLLAQAVAYIATAIIAYAITLIAIEGVEAAQSFPVLGFLNASILLESIVVGTIAPVAFLLASRAFASKGDERTARPLKAIGIVLAVLAAASLAVSILFPGDASDIEEMAELIEDHAREAPSAEDEAGRREEPADFTGPRIWGTLAPRAEGQASVIKRIILDQPAYRDDFSSNDEIARYYDCPYLIEGTVTSPVESEITFLVEDGGGVLPEDEEIRVSMSWVAARLYGMKGLQYGMDGVLIFFKEIPSGGDSLKAIVVVGNDDVPKNR